MSIDFGPVKKLHHADGPDTEAEAAYSLGTKREAHIVLLVRAIADHPEGLTGDEAVYVAGLTERGSRPRVTEALQAKLVEVRKDDNGRTLRKVWAGHHPAMLHFITDLGWTWLKDNE